MEETKDQAQTDVRHIQVPSIASENRRPGYQPAIPTSYHFLQLHPAYPNTKPFSGHAKRYAIRSSRPLVPYLPSPIAKQAEKSHHPGEAAEGLRSAEGGRLDIR